MISKQCKSIIWDDYLRLCHASNSSATKSNLIRNILNNDVFSSIFWYRVANDLYEARKWGLRGFVRYMQKRCQRRTNIELVAGTEIGRGLRIAHRGTIVIAGKTIIGTNCTLYQNVTIGRTFGLTGGTPIIGNNVVIFPGVQVIGNIRIGDNVIIGAGSLVIKDVPSNCVVGGNPAKIISTDSSDERFISKQWQRYFI